MPAPADDDRLDPYAAPAARVDDAPAEATEAERIRREHLRHEGRLQSVGWLYWLGTLLFGSMAVTMGVVGLSEAQMPAMVFAVSLVYLALAIGFACVGWGYRKLRPWVRIPGAIFSGLGLLAIPLGTLINGYILFLMFGAKGQRVLSPDYERIRAQTPHLRFRRSTAEVVAMIAVVVVPAALLFWFARRG